MSKIDDIKSLIDSAEYEYNKRCKATGYRYVPFEYMMIGYLLFLISIFAGVLYWAW